MDPLNIIQSKMELGTYDDITKRVDINCCGTSECRKCIVAKIPDTGLSKGNNEVDKP